MDKLVHLVRRLLIGRDARLARQWQARNAQQLGSVSARFIKEAAIRPGRKSLVLARAETQSGRGFWAGLPMDEALASHWWVTGATGTGKTYWTICILMQLIRSGKVAVIVDPKGELAALLRTIVLPALFATSPSSIPLDQVRIIRPFDREFVPLLRLTEPEAGVSAELQSLLLAESLSEAGGAEIGHRMHQAFAKMAQLSIELNLPLSIVADWLDSPQLFLRDARRSGDPRVRAYARGAFPRENQETVRALRSRLGAFFQLGNVRQALSAPSCLRFADCLEGGVTIFDLGDPPLGLERTSRFWGAVFVGRLMRAVFNRQIRENSPHALVVLEEAQEILASSAVASLSRLLALARSQRTSIMCVNQQRRQVGPELTKLLRTNTKFEVAFRCSREDAEAIGHALPVPSGAKRPLEARREIATALTRLPKRSFLFWMKDRPYPGQLVRSPRLDVEAMRAAAAQVPGEVRRRLRQGTVAVPREVEQYASPAEEGLFDPGLFSSAGTAEDEGFPSLG